MGLFGAEGTWFVSWAVVLGLGLAWGFLHVFYRLVESEWPASYYVIERDLDRRISSSPIAYLAFRFGPVYAMSVFLAVTLARLGEPIVVPSLFLGALHMASTSGRATFSLMRRGQASKRPLVLTFHLLVSFVTVAVAIAGSLTESWYAALVPPAEELSSNIWTGLLAGVIGAFLVHVTRFEGGDLQGALEKSRQAIPDEVWDFARDTAQRVNGEPRLVHAFLLVENLQRPKWVRRAEQVAGRLFGAGTYGPLQLSLSAPRPELGALENAIERRFAGQRAPLILTSWGAPKSDEQWIRVFALGHNPSKEFADDVVLAYQWLEYPRRSKALIFTERRAPDNLPTLEVHRVGRKGATMLVSGTAVAYEGTVVVRQADEWGQILKESFFTCDVGAPARGAFEAEIELLTETATVELMDQALLEEETQSNPVELSERTIRIPAIK